MSNPKLASISQDLLQKEQLQQAEQFLQAVRERFHNKPNVDAEVEVLKRALHLAREDFIQDVLSNPVSVDSLQKSLNELCQKKLSVSKSFKNFCTQILQDVDRMSKNTQLSENEKNNLNSLKEFLQKIVSSESISVGDLVNVYKIVISTGDSELYSKFFQSLEDTQLVHDVVKVRAYEVLIDRFKKTAEEWKSVNEHLVDNQGNVVSDFVQKYQLALNEELKRLSRVEVFRLKSPNRPLPQELSNKKIGKIALDTGKFELDFKRGVLVGGVKYTVQKNQQTEELTGCLTVVEKDGKLIANFSSYSGHHKWTGEIVDRESFLNCLTQTGLTDGWYVKVKSNGQEINLLTTSNLPEQVWKNLGVKMSRWSRGDGINIDHDYDEGPLGNKKMREQNGGVFLDGGQSFGDVITHVVVSSGGNEVVIPVRSPLEFLLYVDQLHKQGHQEVVLAVRSFVGREYKLKANAREIIAAWTRRSVMENSQ
ncbi:MAG: hypothetical protein NZO16_00485 [Deltaproteobacteria bacterium]|nr:hypothetical protein [Deltaproteobacteria bacterium]